MKKEEKDNLHKWLNKTLSKEELEAFKQTRTYQENEALVNYFEAASIPKYNVNEEITKLQKQKNIKIKSSISKSKVHKNKQWLKIAASLLILLSISYFVKLSFNNNPLYTTDLAEQKKINLPDLSTVNLNAGSTLNFEKENWATNRDISLKGEGYFQVAKGSTFSVNTSYGTVRVLGTKFNIKQRKDLFEVTCYEGLVEVEHNKKTYLLKKGHYFSVIKNEITVHKTVNDIVEHPFWLNDRSYFKQIPIAMVFKDFELHYDVKIKLDKTIDLNKKFTGGYNYNNTLDESLKSICLVFDLSYEKKNEVIYIMQ